MDDPQTKSFPSHGGAYSREVQECGLSPNSHPSNTGGRQGERGTNHVVCGRQGTEAGRAAPRRKHASALTVSRSRSPARTGAEAFASLAPGRIPAGYGGEKEERKQAAPAPERLVTTLKSLETAASRSAGSLTHLRDQGHLREGLGQGDSAHGTRSSGRAPPSGGGLRGGELVPYTASIRPVAGHAGGQQQRRHRLIEEEVIVDELLLLRFGHALERVVLA